LTVPFSCDAPAVLAANGTQAFDAQCIPTDTALLTPDSYKAFLAARRLRISQRLNEFLGLGGREGEATTESDEATRG